MNRMKDRKGFSILEVLIGIFLLSIGIMGLATLQSRGIRSNDLANRTTQAANLAQFKLEELIHRSVEEHFAAGVTNDPDNPVDGVFSRSWEFTDNSPVPTARTITVIVTWTDIMGQHQATAEGMITTDSY